MKKEKGIDMEARLMIDTKEELEKKNVKELGFMMCQGYRGNDYKLIAEVYRMKKELK